MSSAIRRTATSPRNRQAASHSRVGQSGANDRGLIRLGSRRKWSTAVDRARPGRSGRRACASRSTTWPSVTAGQRLERGRVRPQLAVLVGVGDRDAGGDHALDVVRAAIAEVDEVVAAGLGVLDRRLVAARARSAPARSATDFRSGSTTFPWIWRKLRNWLFLSSASTTTLIRPSLAADVERQVAAVGRPHRPADHLRPERGVALPVGPGLGPAPAGVGGEGDRAAQAVGPVGQHRVDLAGRQRRDDRDLDQLVLLGRGQDQPGDRRQLRRAGP